MSTVWLIRDGESQSNAGLPTLSPVFPGLTKRGIVQAESIAQAFTRVPSLIITSRYKQTKKTALPTTERFPNTKQGQWVVHEFTYLSKYRSAFMNVQDRRPMVDDYWERNDPFYNDGDGAESFIQFISRVSAVLERLRYCREDFIAVFTHGQFMRAVWWLLNTYPGKIDSHSMREFRNLLESISIPNGAILQVKLRGREKTCVGDIIVSHLPQVEGSQPLGDIHQVGEDSLSLSSI